MRNNTLLNAVIFVIVIVFLFFCGNSYAEEIRKASVAGRFYPADKEELAKNIDVFLLNVKKVNIPGRIFAIVVPHAGYVYSGQVAAHAFKQLEGTGFKKIIIVSPSHYAAFDGISVYNKGYFETPLGLVKIDEVLADKIMERSKRFIFYPESHKKEHGIETELPFLQRIYKDGDFTIVPITMGNPVFEDSRVLSDALYGVMDDDTLLIISVDLSHYYPYEKAVEMDTSGISAIEKLDAGWFLNQLRNGETEVDAPIAVLGAIMFANRYNAKAKVLKYANSGDTAGDKSRVVGYSSIVMYVPGDLEKKEEMVMGGEYLNKEEKKKLIEIAKASIIEAVTGKKGPEVEITGERLKENHGAFVTIKKHNELRGCIGYIFAERPLYETVKNVAASAAISDPRFSPVSEKELDEIELEVSVLTPLKRITGIEEIIPGKHGLYMKRGFNSGLLLPQVATEEGWDRETFLEHTSMKAGLPKSAWKDASTEIYLFSALVFSEKDTQ